MKIKAQINTQKIHQAQQGQQKVEKIKFAFFMLLLWHIISQKSSFAFLF